MKKKLLILIAATLFLLSLSNLAVLADDTNKPNPKYGGTLRVAHNSDPMSFNGLVNFWSTSTYLQRQVFNTLLAYDINYQTVPELATALPEISEDQLTFTFHLRDNVYWHDGEKFTSADVKFHYELMALPEIRGGPGGSLEFLVSIETPDDYTVIFEFSQLSKPPWGTSQSSRAFILPKHIYEGTDYETNPANWDPIGTGPFKVKEYVQDQYIIFEANENYFLGRPYLDELIFSYYGDSQSAVIALEAGEIDYIDHKRGVPATEFFRLMDVEGITTNGWRRPVVNMMTFNFREEAVAKHPWITDANVRKAIEYAIDKEGIKNTVFGGWANPAYGFVCDFLPAWYNPNLELLYYNNVEAERLLDEAGYPRGSDGVRFEMDLVCYSSYADWAEVIKEYLRGVGITVELKLVESTTFFQLYELGEEGLQDIACGLNNQGVGANVGEIRRSWIYGGTGEAPRGSMNMGFYANERVDELFDIMQGTLDYETQRVAIYEIQEILQEEKPYIFMFNAMTRLAYDSDFHLAHIHECYDESYYDVWWEGGTAGPAGETVTETVTETETETVTETVGGGETITTTETVTTGVSTIMAGGLAIAGIVVGAVAGMYLFKKS